MREHRVRGNIHLVVIQALPGVAPSPSSFARGSQAPVPSGSLVLSGPAARGSLFLRRAGLLVPTHAAENALFTPDDTESFVWVVPFSVSPYSYFAARIASKVHAGPWRPVMSALH